jgi:hypothetical protein
MATVGDKTVWLDARRVCLVEEVEPCKHGATLIVLTSGDERIVQEPAQVIVAMVEEAAAEVDE